MISITEHIALETEGTLSPQQRIEPYVEVVAWDARATEIANTPLPYAPVQSWPALGESSFTETDALSRAQEIELPGIPFVNRSSDVDKQTAVPQLTVRQAC